MLLLPLLRSEEPLATPGLCSSLSALSLGRKRDLNGERVMLWELFEVMCSDLFLEAAALSLSCSHALPGLQTTRDSSC